MATKSRSRSAGKPSQTSSQKKAAETRAANRERARRQREARGVLLIAFGVLLGVYLFVSGTGVLGAFLSRLLFGLCGWFAYVLPVVLIGAGVLAIAGRNGSSSGSAGWVLTGIVAALTLTGALSSFYLAALLFAVALSF